MSELKRAHGLGRLRVRRKNRVRLQVAFKATACNIKRWAAASTRPRPATAHEQQHTPVFYLLLVIYAALAHIAHRATRQYRFTGA